MAGFMSDSDSEYGLGLSTSDEDALWDIVDRISAESPQKLRNPAVQATRATPATLAPQRNLLDPAENARVYRSFSTDLDPDATLAIEETIAAISDNDLNFDISELQEGDSYVDEQVLARRSHGVARSSPPAQQNRRLAPSVSSDDSDLASFVSRTKPRSLPTLLPGPDISYPDLSGALTELQDTAGLPGKAQEASNGSARIKRSPLLRFRTFPMKPLSVTDLTSGLWCELQHYYTLTNGRKTRTGAMKRGTKVHKALEDELFTPVQIDIDKKEDTFGLKLWNMIQGLRVLREQGFTREFELWGMVDGNVVSGVVDGLSYENPDEELQEDLLSSRGNSQVITNSQPYEPSTPDDYQIFITDVKTRNTASPAPRPQVRVSIIQLFLYHRFVSDMASDKLDYMRVFERYGLNPDEPFSDAFMAQIGTVYDEIFTDTDSDGKSESTLDNGRSPTTDGGSNGDFVSVPSSPRQVSFAVPLRPTLKYHTLRTLLPLLKSEVRLTFPRGATDVGNIVAVEYRYRGRDTPPPPALAPRPHTPDPDAHSTAIATNPLLNADETDPVQAGPAPPPRRVELEPGSVICTNTFFVEPRTLDLFIAETMPWWRGERPPHGVPPEEAAFKCRSCEFANDCSWRRRMNLDALQRAGKKADVEMSADASEDSLAEKNEEDEMPKRGVGRSRDEADLDGDGDIEDGGMRRQGVKKGRGRGRPRGRPRKDASKTADAGKAADAEGPLEVDDGDDWREMIRRNRGRARKLVSAGYGA